MAEYGINRQEAFHKLQKRKEYKWAEDYADLKDQIDRAIDKGLHYVNTCLCDFDRMTKTEKHKVSSQSRWTYRRLLQENYAVVICIKGEPVKRKGDEFFSDTFMHIRWGDKFPLLYNIKNKLLDLRTWHKDIDSEFKFSTVKQTEPKKKEAISTRDDSSMVAIIEKTVVEENQTNLSPALKKKNNKLINKPISLRINLRKTLFLKNSKRCFLKNKQLSLLESTRQQLNLKRKIRLNKSVVSIKQQQRTRLYLISNTVNQANKEQNTTNAAVGYNNFKNFFEG